MKANWNRDLEHKLKYSFYLLEYERRFPNNDGFDHRKDCGTLGGKGCTCWVCKSLEWGLNVQEAPKATKDFLAPHENSVIKTVVIVLIILWVIVKFNSSLNEEYYKKNAMYKLPEPSTEKHWLYK